LSHTCRPFHFSYFLIGPHVFAQVGLGPVLCMPPSSWDDRSTPSHPAIYWLRWFSLTFCLGWSWTVILPIWASLRAGITDVSHGAWQNFLFYS
jgi:hypothetical protein